MRVRDEDGSQLGMINQPQDGIPTVTMARLLELRSQAPVTKESPRPAERPSKRRSASTHQSFRKCAEWLNSKPLTWEVCCAAKSSSLSSGPSGSTRAEPCGLVQLERPLGAREVNGLTVIGIHTPGSPRESITKAINQLHLVFPTCVDVPAEKGEKAWGALFSDFAVQAIPHAVAVDGNGIVVASGRLNEVHAKASGLVGKSPAPVKGDQ